MDSPVNQPALPRTRYAVAAVFMQVLLGVIYAWSVFRGPLEQAYGWSKSQTIAPYRYSLLIFAVGMIVGGLWQDRVGPRVVATAGGLLLGTGWLLAAVMGHTPAGLVLAYGCVAALGVGFAYVTPIAMCLKWYPDKRGMIVGLAVMGFGVGPLLFGPLLEGLIGKDPALLTSTLPRTFLVLAIMSYLGVMGAAQFYRVPPSGWRPPGWSPSATSGMTREDYGPQRMLRTWQFYAAWVLYFLGTSVGLTAIGEATPLLRQMAQASTVISAGVALGIMAIFNGAGRLLWGAVSDRLGRRQTAIAMCLVSVVACVFFLRAATGFWQLLAGLCLAALGYGGYLAVMPSLTADFYGPKHVGANYGMMFSAWGVCGFVVPGYFARITDRASAAGNLAGGYNEVYLTLAAMAVAGAVVAAVLRPPRYSSQKSRG